MYNEIMLTDKTCLVHAKAGNLRESQVKSMDADALVLCISSGAMLYIYTNLECNCQI